MKKNYQVISRQDRRALAHWLTKNGQGLLPLVELVEGAEIALEELIDVTGRDHRGGAGTVGAAGGGRTAARPPRR